MKNMFKILVPVAAAAIALVSCQPKEEQFGNNPAGEVTIRVHAQADNLKAGDQETKTYIDNSNTIIWGTGEYMKLALTAGETTTFVNSTDASADAFDGDPEAMFEFNVTPGDASEYVYQGLYPASAAATNSNTNAANYKVNLPAIQNATASSYDPAAYIMVAKPETFDAVQTDWVASYRRATALNKITLKNFASSVSINRVQITVPANKYLAGGRHINLSTDVAENVLGDIYNGGGRTETIEVKYATALTGTSMDVWFTSWGVEIAEGETITIVAYTTDSKSYTKTITVPAGKTIKFQEGYLNTLGAKMENIAAETVTELQEGNYLVLATDGDNYYALKAETVSSDTRMASVEYSGSTIEYAGDADMVWSVSKSGNSYIIANSGKYLGFSGNDNKAFWLAPDTDWTETEYLLDITWNADNSCYYVTLNSAPSRKLQRVASNNWFAFYTSSQQGNLIFVPATVDSRSPVTLSFAEETISKTTANYSEFSGQTATASPNVSGITYAIEGDSIGTINTTSGAVTLNGTTGSATVTATFAGDASNRPASASYSIIVSDASTLTLTFPFDSVISGWPGSSSTSAAGSYTYSLSGTDYTFTHTKVGNGIYCSTSYLMIVSGNYLGLPAISGYKLSSVSAQLNAGGQPSTAAIGTVTSNTTGTVVSGGEEQTFDTKGESKTFTLTGTAENTVYYLAISNKNFQCTELVLVYEVAAPDTRDEAGMSWSTVSATASIENGDAITFTAPTLSNPNSVSPVAYESTDTDVAEVSATGAVTVKEEGETTIKAIFAGNDDYKPQTVSYTLTVTDNRTPVASTIATILADDTITADNTVDYAVSGVTVMAAQGKNYVIGDATGVMLMFYNSSTTLTVGNQYDINGGVKLYNGVHEFNNPTVTTGTGSAPAYGTPETMTASSLTLYASSPVTKYAIVSLTAPASGYVGSDGTNDINVYDGTGKWASFYGKSVVVTGYLIGYSNSKINFLATAIEEDTTTPSLNVSPSALSWAAAETDSKTITVTLNGAASGYSVSPTSDANWNIADNGSGTITVSPKAANTSTDAAKTLTLTITHNDKSTLSEQVTCTQAKASSGGTQTYVDILTQSWTGVTSTSYTNWSGKSGSASSAVYAGNSAGGNSSIQLRSTNSNSGVVTTTSGGKVKKIVVTWNNNTTSGRTLNVYGKNSAYSQATDLYDNSKKGTLLGTIVCGTSTELTITGDYTHIGFCSASGAMYLSEVKITWEK